jgi:hypothetical protein
MLKERIGVSGRIIWRSHPLGTIDRYNELMEKARVYEERTLWQWLLGRQATFSHFDKDILAEAQALIKSGKIEVEQKNLIVDSSNYGIDILVQYLLSAYNGSNPFPLGIAWGEVGTGATTPTAGDTALTAPTNRAPVAFAQDSMLNTAQFQFFFPDAVLANGTYTECGSFIGGSSSIGSGNMFNHALFASPYSKSSGVDSTLEIDIALANS